MQAFFKIIEKKTFCGINCLRIKLSFEYNFWKNSLLNRRNLMEIYSKLYHVSLISLLWSKIILVLEGVHIFFIS